MKYNTLTKTIGISAERILKYYLVPTAAFTISSSHDKIIQMFIIFCYKFEKYTLYKLI